MPAADGTPTIWEKIAAPFDGDAATLAGDKRDLTKVGQTLLGLFKPILDQAETTGLGDLTAFLQAIAGLSSVTSVSQATNIVNAALEAEAGTLQKQAIALGQTSLTTLISAALAAVGKVNLPLVG